MKLVSTARNPIPTGAVTGEVTARDGIRLRFARWAASAGGRAGTVCLLQGRTEFIEKYFETVMDLRRRGFAVAALDWRGQGGSQRLLRNPRKGHVDDFADYEKDLSAFMTDIVLPDCPPPYFALAHSMGGTVMLRAARARDCWFDRVVLCAPMVGLTGIAVPPGTLAAITTAASYLGLGEMSVPGAKAHAMSQIPFEGNVLTGDAARFTRNQDILKAAPELVIEGPTMGWLRAALASMKLIASPDYPQSVQVPALMFAAGGDRVVSSRAIERLAVQLKTGNQIVLRGSEHEILQERDDIRSQFWAAFDAFVPGSR
ncbi:MAG: alpha/beta fold hydrolase [Hyphomicrobiales bacterium]